VVLVQDHQQVVHQLHHVHVKMVIQEVRDRIHVVLSLVDPYRHHQVMVVYHVLVLVLVMLPYVLLLAKIVIQYHHPILVFVFANKTAHGMLPFLHIVLVC
jgi:hypothetical protein